MSPHHGLSLVTISRYILSLLQCQILLTPHNGRGNGSSWGTTIHPMAHGHWDPSCIFSEIVSHDSHYDSFQE
ncbi:hypothetical protein HAX54_001062, partial [Datura stramonium]|nr:hypothetical protein [Datura stramonium]